jgi:hypothetical protein
LDYRDRSVPLRLIGVCLLLIGVAAAFFGPLEVYCFYLFSEGGPFHYEGFGFGSFMFGNLAIQIMGYYLVALVLIPLGYGHLRLWRWVRPASLTLLWSWLVVGLPLAAVFLFILFSSKDLSLAIALGFLVAVALMYPLVPLLFIRVYRSANVRLTLESTQPRPSWLEGCPVPALVLACLLLFYMVVLHVLLFFRGIFPVFGFWLANLQGFVLIALSVLCLALLTWGVLRLWNWAWWGALIYFGLLAVSVVLTLVRSSYADMIVLLDFPQREVQFLRGIPMEGYHFAMLAGLPLLLTLGWTIYARRYFRAEAISEKPSQLNKPPGG